MYSALEFFGKGLALRTAVILAGGQGTRILEKGDRIPKPLIPIGGKPIIGHIIDWYCKFGVTKFIAATGYLGQEIEKYFRHLSNERPGLDLIALDTGLHSQTGERIRRVLHEIHDNEFFLTYGDGLSNVNILDLLNFHQAQGRIMTVTAVRPPARFGRLIIEDERVTEFSEKESSLEGWINGGYFVMKRDIQNYIELTNEPLEAGPLNRLTRHGQLSAFRHEGFWHPMDTRREQEDLEKMWSETKAPWAP
jgi:glucose-1-phosphate cytidylyltransferase